ncbi:MAG: ArnT family glycosyltransferase, partial [Ardenticatenaceae bacterium]
MSESTISGRPVVTDSAATGGRSLLSRVGGLLAARSMAPFWLGVILLVGAFFRFTGVDWDEGHHLHPDERFLSQVLSDTQWPQSNFLRSYFDEATSTLNPRNVGKTFFVYGDFPIIFTKGVTVALDKITPRADGASWQGYGYNYMVGRVLDALMDLGTLLMIFVLARRLYGDHRVALLASLLYAGTALAIQQAHFFVVDPFTAFFVTVALYFMVRIFQEGRLRDYLLAGAFVGLSLATKLSIFTLALVMVAVAGYRFYVESRERGAEISLERVGLRLVLSGVAALVVIRLFQP